MQEIRPYPEGFRRLDSRGMEETGGFSERRSREDCHPSAVISNSNQGTISTTVKQLDTGSQRNVRIFFRDWYWTIPGFEQVSISSVNQDLMSLRG
jgi:hypothetical protein